MTQSLIIGKVYLCIHCGENEEPLSNWAAQSFFGQKHIRLHVTDPWQCHDPAAQNTFKVGQITGDDPQPVIIKP